ncbi:GTP cyclohydrolase II [Roseomonas sp. 18066]|uniref:GTP cyclohydrolase II n=1 Tax=Roseomonas sp. 18066 TaxID=2681412 RepID=UPI001356FC7B|nr:GTP cyclohydrolase II [Roseomonas sp. 18066]
MTGLTPPGVPAPAADALPLNRLRGNGPIPRPIILTSHPRHATGDAPVLRWGAADPLARGPVVATLQDPTVRNAIGTHSGAYALYRALAVAAGQLKADHRPDFHNTRPASPIGPFPAWGDPEKIVSIDPFGHLAPELFAGAGLDIRPSIAVTRAQINMPELTAAMRDGRLQPDGEVLLPNGDARVTKIAIEPVWFIPGVAARFGITETELRRHLFEQTGGMFPELVTRPDLQVFLPPIGGMTVYLFGDTAKLGREETRIACRIHDECNGSDVFGSDICTCRPYLAHGIEACIGMAQEGGVGVIVYNRKEGRALGEVTKFLVYNARKRQEGGDRAEAYFARTECVAGVQDMRFQELMPDVLHWLGITRIDRLVSMSNMKFAPIVQSGITVLDRVAIPEGLIPPDAQVEMDAKKAAGYFSEHVPDAAELAIVKGRAL